MILVGRAPAASVFLLLALFWLEPLPAIPVEALDSAREWRVKDVIITGNEKFSTGELEEILTTKTRDWYAFWRSRPVFDPAAFAADLERLARFYQAHGYYEAKVSHDLEVDREEGLVVAKIMIHEGEPARVGRISLELVDAPELKPELEALLPKLPLKEGEIFSEVAYQLTETGLKAFLYDRSRARVEVQRKAEVILERREARVFYTVKAGPETRFGSTTIQGLKDVSEEIVSRELTYKPGEPFSGQALRESEQNLRQLDLFSLIRFELENRPQDPTIVPIDVQLAERPPREIRVGIGYGTEDQLRGQLRWRHNNWLGGARKLEIGAKASFIARELELSFVQPHFLGAKNRFLLNLKPHQLDEPGFFLNATRLQSRIERKFTRNLTGFIGHRVEYDRLDDVSSVTIARLEDFEREGVLSGLSMGLLWNKADDPLNPTKGWTLSFAAEQVGGFLGGDFSFYKLQGEAKGYYPLAAKTVFASRLKLGFADPFDGGKEVPLFERFYAGGSASVRGFGRHRLGPLAGDDPLGGRSLIEGSFELRQQFTDTLGGALFIDFGQVSVRSFKLPMDDLRFAGGFGVRYATPIGPLRLDIGFPFRPPRNDASWQIHFSVGQSF
jgi:outer membrane protein insertion porin family/translocation and assembly module TamA